MKFFRQLLPVIVPLLFMSHASVAVDKEGKYILLGGPTGTSRLYSCGDWHEATRNNTPDLQQMKAWLFGYVSGVNYLAPGNDVRLQGNQIMTYVDKYCTENPLDSLSFAVNALVDQAGGPKAYHTWKK